MRVLVPGERAAVPDALTLALDAPVEPPLALALLAVDGAHRPVPEFPPTDTGARELRPGAAFDEAGALHLTFAELPATVERLVLAAFLSTGPGGGAAFRAWQRLELSAGALRFPLSLVDRTDTAVVLAELYQHAGGWRLAANGQGFVGGLPALAAAYGADRGWAERLIRSPRAEPDARPSPSTGGSGSGVAVDARHVLTNAHVVDAAQSIWVAGEAGRLAAEPVFADLRNDLALLRVAEALPAAARFREGLELHLGEEVTALGFPLQGLLGSGPQASAGNIAALSGMGNDTGTFQFTAPIASGNSGGPILDASGLVVGLVCSSLNLERVRAGGGSAENVNFGIKGATVRSFLDAYGLTPTLGRAEAAVARAQMVRGARAALCRIACA